MDSLFAWGVVITNLLSFIEPVLLLHAMVGEKSDMGVTIWKPFSAFLASAMWILFETITEYDAVVLGVKGVSAAVLLLQIIAIVYYSEDQIGLLKTLLQALVPFVALVAMVSSFPEAIGLLASFITGAQSIWRVDMMMKVRENTIPFEQYSYIYGSIYAVNSVMWSIYAVNPLNTYILVPNLLLSCVAIAEITVVAFGKKTREKEPLLDPSHENN